MSTKQGQKEGNNDSDAHFGETHFSARYHFLGKWEKKVIFLHSTRKIDMEIAPTSIVIPTANCLMKYSSTSTLMVVLIAGFLFQGCTS